MTEIIDLSHSVEPGMPVYPGSESPVIKTVSTVRSGGYLEHAVSFYTHTGTHIDVPAHLIEHGNTIDAYACEKFYGTATVINCQALSKITADQVRYAYEKNDKPDFLLFYSDWTDFWGTLAYNSGFPVLTPDAAAFLSKLPLKGVGIDAISFDPVGDEMLSNHIVLLGQDIILIENLCRLKQLLNKKFYFSCQPLKIKGADGSPVRAIAIIC